MIKARDIMTTSVLTVRQTQPALDALKTILENNITGLPVVDEDMTLTGIVSEKDLLRLYFAGEGAAEQKVADYMTQPAIYFEQQEPVTEICRFLIERQFQRVPVVNNKGRLVGIVSSKDILRQILEKQNNGDEK